MCVCVSRLAGCLLKLPVDSRRDETRGAFSVKQASEQQWAGAGAGSENELFTCCLPESHVFVSDNGSAIEGPRMLHTHSDCAAVNNASHKDPIHGTPGADPASDPGEGPASSLKNISVKRGNSARGVK